MFFYPFYKTLFCLIFVPQTIQKSSQNDPPGDRKVAQNSLPTEKCEKLKSATPPMRFLHFRGLEGPVGDPGSVQVAHFFDLRNQYEFGYDFSLNMTPILEHFWSK